MNFDFCFVYLVVSVLYLSSSSETLISPDDKSETTASNLSSSGLFNANNRSIPRSGLRARAHSAPNDPNKLHVDSRRGGNDYLKLVCRFELPAGATYDISLHVKATVLELSVKYPPTCICAYDKTGRCRQAPHMCTTPSNTRYCRFSMKNIVVTKPGGLFDVSNHYKFISRADPSISGFESQYFPGYSSQWLEGFPSVLSPATKAALPTIKRAKKLVPLRMRWDDCFNHVSFQSVPLLAIVTELISEEEWRHFSWHSSFFTSALLDLMGVPKQRVVVEQGVLAEEVVLPWIPGWCPIQTAPSFGIARRLIAKLTYNLLNRRFEGNDAESIVLRGKEHLAAVDLYGWDYVKRNFDRIVSKSRVVDKTLRLEEVKWENVSRTSETRYVVYFKRYMNVSRAVVNEKELLDAIESWLPPHLKLVVLGHTVEYKTVEALHRSWQRYARIVSKARILIGPHGGALNNLVWMPADCDVIEFNEFPDEVSFQRSHGKTPVRAVFLNAFWAKGSETGRFWIIEASLKHTRDFYMGKMRICVREVLEVFHQIQLGVQARRSQEEHQQQLSRANWDCSVMTQSSIETMPALLKRFPSELHDVWPGGQWSYQARPPPG